jgi:hypothetical protein
MLRSFKSFNFQPAEKPSRTTVHARGVTDYLRVNDKMSALMPAVARMAALQRDCAALLPATFDSCSILQFESGQLVLSVSSSALASKLKQQLPKLQEGLLQRGWQINAIRLKLQPKTVFEPAERSKNLALPERAISALAELNGSLEDSPRNEALKTALAALLSRHR